jgi:hypothetical protein
LPPLSESFWTSLLALFFLHLGKSKHSDITVWTCTRNPSAPWYERRREAATLNLRDLELHDVAVEPVTLEGEGTFGSLNVPSKVGGISPDLFIRLRSNSPGSATKHVLIECKTVGAELNLNQKESYPNLLAYLNEQGIGAELLEYLLVMSVGVSNRLYRDAQNLQGRMGSRGLSFGLLLWEDILQKMKGCGFHLPGIDIDGWQVYTDDLKRNADLS